MLSQKDFVVIAVRVGVSNSFMGRPHLYATWIRFPRLEIGFDIKETVKTDFPL